MFAICESYDGLPDEDHFQNLVFYVDVPTGVSHEHGEESWRNVHVAGTMEEAVAWIREVIGPCDDEGNVCLITR
jgi:hypothetical protein